jgi:hypothetical protein
MMTPVMGACPDTSRTADCRPARCAVTQRSSGASAQDMAAKVSVLVDEIFHTRGLT